MAKQDCLILSCIACCQIPALAATRASFQHKGAQAALCRSAAVALWCTAQPSHGSAILLRQASPSANPSLRRGQLRLLRLLCYDALRHREQQARAQVAGWHQQHGVLQARHFGQLGDAQGAKAAQQIAHA